MEGSRQLYNTLSSCTGRCQMLVRNSLAAGQKNKLPMLCSRTLMQGCDRLPLLCKQIMSEMYIKYVL